MVPRKASNHQIQLANGGGVANLKSEVLIHVICSNFCLRALSARIHNILTAAVVSTAAKGGFLHVLLLVPPVDSHEPRREAVAARLGEISRHDCVISRCDQKKMW